ncbi:MAG: hypothetical protein HYZ27_01565, partial [Deltaproteobacteria bacterium]|nr:hypothetical protein [Deltaproteobacteria bacterium]
MTRTTCWILCSTATAVGCAGNGSTSDDFAAQGHAPVAVVTSLVSAAEGELVTLDGSRSYDADGDLKSYAWTQTAGSPTVTLIGLDRAAATFTAPNVNGTTSLAFALTVTDGQGATSSALVSVSILDLNPAPRVDAGPDQNVNAGDGVMLSGVATDNGGPPTFAWRQVAGIPSVSLANDSTAEASFTAPDLEQPRVLTFELTATDNEGKAASDQVVVSIEPVAVGLRFVAASVPTSVLRNATWSPEVEVVNASNQRITGGAASRLAITLSAQPTSGSASGMLSGTLSGTARFGVLRLTDLLYDDVTPVASPLRLAAEATPLPVASSPAIAVTWPSALPGGVIASSAITVRAVTLLNNDLVVAGSFDGINVDFDPSSAVVERTSVGLDGFVARYNVLTGALAWVQVIGGPGVVEVTGVAPTAAGGLVITAAYVASAEFPVDGGPPLVPTAHGGTDAAVAGLSGTGYTLWLADFGGLGDDTPAGVALDSAGNILVAGGFQRSVDFDPGAGTALESSVNESLDAFVLKLTPAGAYVWHAVWGSAQDDWAASLAVHTSQGALYFGGTSDALALVGRVASTGSITWAHVLGSSQGTAVTALAADSSGNVYAAGEFLGNGDFDPGTGDRILMAAGNADAFALSLSATAALRWAVSYGGAEDEEASTIFVRPGTTPSVVLGGSFAGVVDFDAGAGIHEVMSSGPRSGYLLSLTPAGGAFEWAGSVESDSASVGVTALTTTATATRIFLAGGIDGASITDIDPGSTRVRFSVPGGTGVYLAKVTDQGLVVP